MPESNEGVDTADAAHAAHAADAVDLQTSTAVEDAGGGDKGRTSKATARSRWRWRWRKQHHEKSAGDENNVSDSSIVASGADI